MAFLNLLRAAFTGLAFQFLGMFAAAFAGHNIPPSASYYLVDPFTIYISLAENEEKQAESR